MKSSASKSVKIRPFEIILACVAGGISRASAFVLVAKLAVNGSGEAVKFEFGTGLRSQILKPSSLEKTGG